MSMSGTVLSEGQPTENRFGNLGSLRVSIDDRMQGVFKELVQKECDAVRVDCPATNCDASASALSQSGVRDAALAFTCTAYDEDCATRTDTATRHVVEAAFAITSRALNTIGDS